MEEAHKMIKIVEYKECTCDMCGAKESIPLEYDMPKDWGWFRIFQNRKISDYHTCADCGERVSSAIENMKG